MTTTTPHEVTRLLVDWSNGNQAALDRLTPLIDHELHRLAQHYMQQERPGHTLQTTALGKEAYLRYIGSTLRDGRDGSFHVTEESIDGVTLGEQMSGRRVELGITKDVP